MEVREQLGKPVDARDCVIAVQSKQRQPVHRPHISCRRAHCHAPDGLPALVEPSAPRDRLVMSGNCTVIEQTATAYIDEALLRFVHRELVTGSEIVDFLLDLRAAVTS